MWKSNAFNHFSPPALLLCVNLTLHCSKFLLLFLCFFLLKKDLQVFAFVFVGFKDRSCLKRIIQRYLQKTKKNKTAKGGKSFKNSMLKLLMSLVVKYMRCIFAIFWCLLFTFTPFTTLSSIKIRSFNQSERSRQFWNVLKFIALTDWPGIHA